MAKEKATIQTPGYISSLLQVKKSTGTADRRSWSIPIAGVWVPFFTATNATGETAIAAEVLGAPLRLAKDTDGTPRFNKSGRPVVRVVKDLSDQVRIVRDNFTAGLLNYVEMVMKGTPDAYKAQSDMAHKAGEPIYKKDMADLTAYLDEAVAKAEASVEDFLTEAEAKAKAEAKAEKELVAA